MSKVQTALLQVDTLWLEHYKPDGQPYKEKVVSVKAAELLLSKGDYKLINTKFNGQKVYMRAVAEINEATKWD